MVAQFFTNLLQCQIDGVLRFADHTQASLDLRVGVRSLENHFVLIHRAGGFQSAQGLDQVEGSAFLSQEFPGSSV